jgi:hypothetical protein
MKYTSHTNTSAGQGLADAATAELYSAVLAGDYLKVVGFASSGGDVTSAEPSFDIQMPYWAADRGHARTLQVLVTLGADKDCRGFNGDRPAHVSARKGDVASAAVLLVCGADPNALNDDLENPLHVASYYGHVASSYILLLAGSDPSAKNRGGLTAADVSAERGDALLEFLHTWHQLCANGEDTPRRLAESSLPFTLLKRELLRFGLTADPDFDRKHLHALTRLAKSAHPGRNASRPRRATRRRTPTPLPLSTATTYMM